MEYYQQQQFLNEEDEYQFPLRRPQATMEDDSSAMQPGPSPSVIRRTSNMLDTINNSSSSSSSNDSNPSSSSYPAHYPCPPPIEPLREPSYQVQLLLGDMFSEQATLRNYCADSMQAFMMALDEQRAVEQERQAEEEASLALILALQKEDVVQEQHDPLSSQHQQPQQPQEAPTSRRRRPSPAAAETDPAAPPSPKHGNGKAKQRMSLISDLTSDLGSIISEDSSLEIPDFFTTTEAVLSHMSLKGFQKEIMPIPLPPLLAGSSDEEKKLKAYAQHLSGGSNSSFSSSQDDHRRRKQRQHHPNSNLKIGYDSDETTKDNQLKKMSDPYHSPTVRIERLTARGSVELMNPPPPPGDSNYCQSVVPPTAAAAAPPPNHNPSSSSSSSNHNKKTKTAKTTNSNGKRKDRQCIICHRSTADCRLRMRKLRCGHQYCRCCIDRWLESNDSCPYCRQKVSEKTRQKVRRQNSVGPTAA